MFNARTVRDQLDDLYNIVRYDAAICGIVGLFGLVLASIGLAGVTAHAAMRRRKELGIRTALGARRGQVFARVLMFDSGLAQSVALNTPAMCLRC